MYNKQISKNKSMMEIDRVNSKRVGKMMEVRNVG